MKSKIILIPNHFSKKKIVRQKKKNLNVYKQHDLKHKFEDT